MVIAALAVTAVALNWITTGDHLQHTISNGYWPVAGVDLVLVGSAAVASLVAWKLRRPASQTETSAPVKTTEVAHA
jgi:hypothetical protein